MCLSNRSEGGDSGTIPVGHAGCVLYENDRTPDNLNRLRPVLLFSVSVSMFVIGALTALTLTTELSVVATALSVLAVGAAGAGLVYTFARWQRRGGPS